MCGDSVWRGPDIQRITALEKIIRLLANMSPQPNILWTGKEMLELAANLKISESMFRGLSKAYVYRNTNTPISDLRVFPELPKQLSKVQYVCLDYPRKVLHVLVPRFSILDCVMPRPEWRGSRSACACEASSRRQLRGPLVNIAMPSNNSQYHTAYTRYRTMRLSS